MKAELDRQVSAKKKAAAELIQKERVLEANQVKVGMQKEKEQIEREKERQSTVAQKTVAARREYERTISTRPSHRV